MLSSGKARFAGFKWQSARLLRFETGSMPDASRGHGGEKRWPVLESFPQMNIREPFRILPGNFGTLCAVAVLLVATAGMPEGLPLFTQKGTRTAKPPAASGKFSPAPAEANPFHVQFVDVTREAGIRFHHERMASKEKLYVEKMGAGVGWLDYDQDGFLDALFVKSGITPLFHPAQPPQPALYRNNGDGTFTDVTARSGIRSDGTIFFGV